jgi:hypothetical protein
MRSLNPIQLSHLWHHLYAIEWLQTGFGLVIGFTGHFYSSWLHFTNHYYAQTSVLSHWLRLLSKGRRSQVLFSGPDTHGAYIRFSPAIPCRSVWRNSSIFILGKYMVWILIGTTVILKIIRGFPQPLPANVGTVARLRHDRFLLNPFPIIRPLDAT